jgi:acyl-homoserine-lactone acylase
MFRSLVLLASVCLAIVATGAELPGTGDDAGKTVIYRDTWGVAHIYAPTVEAGLYAMGYAQAEDRPEQLLKNLKQALGESAEFEGPKAVMADTVVRMLDHYGVAKRHAEDLKPEVRAQVQAFAAGINAWYAAHPEDVPEWWGNRQVDEYMIGAFGRLFLYNWSIDDGFGDLERGGIKPGFDSEEKWSNQWAIAPQRSAVNAAMLYIDPHLSWWGPSRFWEFRIHAGDLHGSGFTLAGQPYIGLGHNANVAWAMTTGGPDTADIYELTLNPDNHRQYKYDDEYRDFTTREETIKIKGGEEKKVTLHFSHHGPIVALRNGKAYALATAYADIANGNEAWHTMNFARDYTGIVDALAENTMFPQNVMCADTSGNIYYQRAGRVPVRAKDYDWSKPVDGSTSKTKWRGIHAAEDHVQILNPEGGYMQNCNIPPDAMMLNSPLRPERYPDYLYQDLGYGPRGGWSNERGARAVELLVNDDSVTIEEALQYAVDTKPFGIERWIEGLVIAWNALPAEARSDHEVGSFIDAIHLWNMRLDPDSAAALKYYYWRRGLVETLGREKLDALRPKLDQYYTASVGEGPVSYQLTEEERTAFIEAVRKAIAMMKEKPHGTDGVYGDVFRVGRDDKSWPVGGGGDGHLTGRTLRSMSYKGEAKDGTRWGTGGQTSTQIVVLTKPIQSWTQPPIGQSDRPESPHYRDQAEKVFSPAKLKETWWLPEQLKDHIESRTVLEGAPS